MNHYVTGNPTWHKDDASPLIELFDKAIRKESRD